MDTDEPLSLNVISASVLKELFSFSKYLSRRDRFRGRPKGREGVDRACNV